MSFKTKTNKKNNVTHRITIEAKHKEILEKINTQKKNNNNNLIKINELNNQLIENKELETKLEILDTIKNLNKEINVTANDEIDYLLDNGNLLFNYYENMEQVSKGEIKSVNNIKQVNTSKKTVMEYFKKDIHKNNNNNNIKEDLCETYFFNNDENYIKNTETNEFNICKTCNIEKILYLSEGKVICKKCGEETNILIDSDKPSYKDPPREITYFSYKRINHFNEWLAQFQAKETTDIPQEVYDEILIELKKERINDMNTLNPKKLREILKKKKKNKYYEHVPHIINKLNGITPPIMTRETEEELRRMFKEIQVPFHKFCPKARKNFLSYSYVLHKFVELLELDEFIPCFMLLKSREKLHQQDQIWKQICEYLNWQYIPSI